MSIGAEIKLTVPTSDDGSESGKRGPTPSDNELELLRLVRLQPRPFATASDIEPDTSVGYKQTRNRLDQLVEDGLLNVRTVGRTNVYWLSDAGKERLAEELE